MEQIKKTSLSTKTRSNLLLLIIAVVWDWLLINEILSPRTLIGSLLMLLGIISSQIGDKED